MALRFGYHHLGRMAQEQRDFVQAERWYGKALAITERRGNEQDAANTYHHLGRMAQEQGDLAQAPPPVQATLKALCEDAGLGPLPAENA